LLPLHEYSNVNNKLVSYGTLESIPVGVTRTDPYSAIICGWLEVKLWTFH